MDAAGTDLARLKRTPGYVEARLTRLSWRRPDAVWRALTEAAWLAKWLSPGTIEPSPGGAVRFDPGAGAAAIASRVSEFEDGRLIAFSWSREGEPARPLRWRLEPAGVGTRLTLTVLTPQGEDAAKACASWEAHLDMLEAALEGDPIPFPLERFQAARAAYAPRLASL
jgi:uncharacterized protein YndB with AHSA1/START domain